MTIDFDLAQEELYKSETFKRQRENAAQIAYRLQVKQEDHLAAENKSKKLITLLIVILLSLIVIMFLSNDGLQNIYGFLVVTIAIFINTTVAIMNSNIEAKTSLFMHISAIKEKWGGHV